MLSRGESSNGPGGRRSMARFFPAALATLLAVAALLTLAAAPASATVPNLCPSGEKAGRCNSPQALAVDQSTGEIYVGDRNNFRVDEFSESGAFLRAFGYGVLNGADQLQTCTTLCRKGVDGLRAGDLAVGPSGDLYLYNQSGAEVQEYALNLMEEVELLRSFGGPGTGPEQFSDYADPLAFDSAGHLWVGDHERLEEFSAAGAFLGEVPLPGSIEVSGLAIDPVSGDFYTLTPGAPGSLVKRKPSGEALETLDAAGHPQALGLDPATGQLFVADNPDNALGNATLLSYSPAGALTAAFGVGEVIGDPGEEGGGTLAFGATAQRLYVASVTGSNEGGGSAVQAFALPTPGPLLVPGSAEAKEIHKTAATLCAKVNPEGAATTARFQYISAAAYQAQKVQAEAEGKTPEEVEEAAFAGALQTSESASLGSDFSPHELCQVVSPLQPAAEYRFRVVAYNANAVPAGVKGEAAAFSVLAPAAIDSISASEVTASSVTLEAQINPLGDATSYRFEYITEAAYLENQADGRDPFAGAALAPLQEIPLGSGSADVSVAQHVQGLVPATAYRFRARITNAVSEANGGPYPGPSLTFTTQPAVAVAGLPDGRGYELVSPPDKHGATLVPINGFLIQAAADGSAIAYNSFGPTEADPPANDGAGIVILSRREGPGQWSTRDVSLPHRAVIGVPPGIGSDYRLFSSDLSQSIVQPFDAVGAFEPLSPAASEQTPYLRTNFAPDAPGFCDESCDVPLVSGCPAAGECSAAVQAAADVPPGTKFGGKFAVECLYSLVCGPVFHGATPDLRHAVLLSGAALTADPEDDGGLYEWSAGAPQAESLRHISALPDGGSAPAPALGAQVFAGVGAPNPISADGRRVVFFSAGNPGHLYLRINATEAPSAVSGAAVDGSQCTEPDKACTVQLDALQGGLGGANANPLYQFASPDGSRVFFTDGVPLTPDAASIGEGGDLYEYDLARPVGERLADLTPEAATGEAAAVLGTLPGASDDAEYLYFVANGALAPGASPGDCTGQSVGFSGACNLYLRHAGRTTLIARLSGDDYPDWSELLTDHTARVSPDGRWLAFMSDRPLTGYDSRDAVSGQPDEEVFLYHAPAGEGEAGRLICASCDPSGARPHGTETVQLEEGLLEQNGFASGSWLAATIPGWTGSGGDALYQAPYLSDQGRLFFNAIDSLVPQDSNGTTDVYEYEPPAESPEPPPNDSCMVASPAYHATSGGCVSLISSGASPKESVFIDASESGSDVFFLTSARLTAKDTDTAIDLYDARVGGGEPEPLKPVECAGDACQSPVAAPEDPTPGSLSFQGPGNPLPPVLASVQAKAKPLTRAQKLARALKACANRPKSKRPACKSRARRAYGPPGKAKKSKGKAKKSNRRAH